MRTPPSRRPEAKRPLSVLKRSSMVQTSSEIPLPSPSFCSSSGLGTAAIFRHCLALPACAAATTCFVLQASSPSWASVTLWAPHPAGLSVPRDNDQLGSLAGAAYLLHNNAGVLRHTQ